MVCPRSEAGRADSVTSPWRIGPLRRRHNDQLSAVLPVMTMRAGATRTLPVARSPERRFVRDLSPLATPRPIRARAGVHLGGGCVAFLVAYVVFQLLHALGRDPKLVAAIAPIPLFARFVASAACALGAGVAIGYLVRDPGRWLRILPAVLAVAIALFVVTIVFAS